MWRMSCLMVAISLLMPTQLFAGGPPRLCLPLAGVTENNADACAKLLGKALDEQLFALAGHPRNVQILRDGQQAYALFHLKKDVALSDIEAALRGSAYSVPRDKLRLFGQATLSVQTQRTADEFKADLEQLPFVVVDSIEQQDQRFQVTIDMPYWLKVGDATFQRTDFSSAASSKSEPKASCHELPSYDRLRDVVARHNGQLTDIHWSAYLGCRMLGAAAE